MFRKLDAQKESRVEEGHLMPDHVHMMLSILPKYAVSQVLGFIKGKSADFIEIDALGSAMRDSVHSGRFGGELWTVSPRSAQSECS